MVFRTFDFFLLRVPRLSSNILHDLNAFENEEEAWNYVAKILQDPEVLDAIYFASESLFEELLDALRAKRTSSILKLLPTLYKYISRMAGRATPYGKFSGISLGKIEELPTSLKISGEFINSYRLDMKFSAYLTNLILDEPTTLAQLKYFTNTTLFETSSRYRYIEFNETTNKRNYRWTWLSKNPLLTCVLTYAKKGRYFEDLLLYMNQRGIGNQKGQFFLRQLITFKLLISELEPIVAGSNSDILLSCLKNVSQDKQHIQILNRLDKYLKTMNVNPRKAPVFPMRKNFCNIHDIVPKNLIQTDMRTGVHVNRINKHVVDKIAMELEELSVLNNTKAPSDLLSFSKRFIARYGAKEIPLLEAIDPEGGIGYGAAVVGNLENSPLLKGFGAWHSKSLEDHKSSFLKSIIYRYLTSGVKVTTTLELSEQDIQAFRSDKNEIHQEFPRGFYVLGNLLFLDRQEKNIENYHLNLLAAGGVSAIPLMTRFCHLDKELEEKLKECVAWEERLGPDVVVAEIVFLPDHRVGNILTRPSFFKYEIPIIGQSNLDEEYRIYLEDLWISVKNEKVFLRSKRLNKQVIPRLSCAHNFHYGMVAYRFLCDLQMQSEKINLSWDWGSLSGFPFLPRVMYKHIILARARWNIPKEAYSDLKGNDNNTKISFLREKYQVPDKVTLVEGDHELPIDLCNSIAAEIILKQLEKKGLILYENLFRQYESPVRGSNGEQYNNEIVIPLRTDKSKSKVRLNPIFPNNRVERNFPPGSEWLFIKVYSGVMEAEQILNDQVLSLVRELTNLGIIRKWFFIRYNDPDPHLRIRFLLRKKENQLPFQQLIDCVNHCFQPLLKGNSHRLVYDTYERELERYGEQRIELCETIFHIDSDTILTLLPLLKLDEENNLRWLAAIKGVEDIFTVFGLDTMEKIALTTSLRDTFLIEFSGYSELKYKLDINYRENRKQVETFLNSKENNNYRICSILANRFDRYNIEVAKNRIYLTDNPDLSELLSSLSHMFINRLFVARQRENEMVIYHFLSKYYLSTIKRKKKDDAMIPN